MLVEAHNSVKKVKRYYSPLRRAYEILSIELPRTSREVILQIVVKAINDLVGLDDIILTLLVFRAYPYITKELLLLPSLTKRA